MHGPSSPIKRPRIGLDAASDGLLLVEWPEKVGENAWPQALGLALDFDEGGARRLTAQVPPSPDALELFASGFGFIGNYTFQTTGGSAQNFPSNFRTADGPQGAFTALGIVAQDRIELPNLSRHSYNLTLYYEKYGLSARARYTWRSSYVSTDSFFFGLPRINAPRGQLNASVNYDINENINIGIEGINITGSDANQFCVNNNALLCFQGLTDRRVTAGVSVKF